jgi:hypothetical protein
MEKKEVVSVEELIYAHAENKRCAGAAIKTLKTVFGVDALTPYLLLHADFYSLCRAKGVGRKTILLIAEVACDLYGMK